MSQKVESIGSKAAIDFIQDKIGSKVNLGTKLRAYGIQENGSPIAIAIFCNPLEKEAQSQYTTELSYLHVEDSDQAKSLLTHFMELKRTVDFFTRAVPDNQVEVFASLGMNLTSRVFDSEITPDRFYEWRNPKYRSYIYKITSTIDSNYYYGRHGTWDNR